MEHKKGERQSDEGGEVVDFPSAGGSKKKPIDARSQTDGFVTHVRPDLARNAVVYLEQEDPKRRHREKVVCAVNVGDFELKYPVNPQEPEKMADDGRTLRRKMWDEAVQALVRIIAESGLNPKFVRNDKNSCRLTVKQDSVTGADQTPDEFYTMELFYCSEFELERRKLEHVKKIDSYEFELRDVKSALYSWKTPKNKKDELARRVETLERDRAFFVATTPDPREMESGLIFKIDLYTTKEYGVTKEKLKSILTRYLDELSRIASTHGTSIKAAVGQ